MKKLIRLILSLTLLFCISIAPTNIVFAQDPVLYNKEIKEEKLQQNDVSNGLISFETEKYLNQHDILIEKKESTQLVKKEKKDNATIENYVRTTLYTYDGSKQEVGTDRAYVTTVTIRIYYVKTYDAKGLEHIALTKVYCSATAPSPQRMKISGVFLRVGQLGWSTGYGYVSNSKNYNVFGPSYITSIGGSHTVTPPKWPAVQESNPNTVGATLSITIKNSGTGKTWTDSFTCNY